jgi:hypothetical protein
MPQSGNLRMHAQRLAPTKFLCSYLLRLKEPDFDAVKADFDANAVGGGKMVLKLGKDRECVTSKRTSRYFVTDQEEASSFVSAYSLSGCPFVMTMTLRPGRQLRAAITSDDSCSVTMEL